MPGAVCVLLYLILSTALSLLHCSKTESGLRDVTEHAMATWATGQQGNWPPPGQVLQLGLLMTPSASLRNGVLILSVIKNYNVGTLT